MENRDNFNGKPRRPGSGENSGADDKSSSGGIDKHNAEKIDYKLLGRFATRDVILATEYQKMKKNPRNERIVADTENPIHFSETEEVSVVRANACFSPKSEEDTNDNLWRYARRHLTRIGDYLLCTRNEEVGLRR